MFLEKVSYRYYFLLIDLLLVTYMFFNLGKKKLLWITIIAVLMAVLLPAFYIFYRWRRKLKEKGDRLSAF